MRIAFVALALLAGVVCVQGVATDIGTFSCPAGQVEDLQCAAQCCEENGGEYSFSDETCTVSSTAAWNAAMRCEQQRNCCKSAGGGGGGCCGTGFILGGLASLAAMTGYAWSRGRKAA